ncbi:MAG: tRNA-binding protein [Acidimicrobiia bacterium]
MSDTERKPTVTADEFFAIDLRVGRVVDVEDFPEARQPAWKLRVDFGPEIGELRTSARVTNYTRDELHGRLVVGAINLGERQIGPVRSQFLVLGSIEPDATVLLLNPEPSAEPGQPIA